MMPTDGLYSDCAVRKLLIGMVQVEHSAEQIQKVPQIAKAFVPMWPNSLTASSVFSIALWAGVEHLDPYLHRFGIKGRAKLVEYCHVSRIAPISDGNSPSAGSGLRCIEGVPTATNIRLEPSVKIHRHEVVQIAYDHTRRDAETAGQRDAQMSEFAAYALPLPVNLDSRHLKIAGIWIKAHGSADPLYNSSHLIVAGLDTVHQVPAEVRKLV